MEYISPIGEIGFVTNRYYQGDLNYKHTGIFKHINEQKIYFDNFSKKFTNYQYNKERNVFLIADSIANLSKYSYMWFNNASTPNGIFENKRYYAFITNMRLVNNATTEVEFTIDIIQTFLFDIDIPPCLVEREHTETDELFEHIVPEDFQVSGLIDKHELKVFEPRLLCGIITNKAIGYEIKDYSGNRKKLVLTLGPSIQRNTATPNNLFWYTGIPITTDDVNYYRENNRYVGYELQPLYELDSLEQPTEEGSAIEFTAGYIINQIVEGKLVQYDIDAINPAETRTSEDNIVAIYVYPESASYKQYIGFADDLGYKRGFAERTEAILPYYPFVSTRNNNTYTPKNKKLYCYPYSSVEVFNNEGQRNTFKPENFSNVPMFSAVYSRLNPPCILIVPINYDGDISNFENSCSITGFPSVYYTGDTLNRYLQQNSEKRTASLISSAVTLSTTLAVSLTSKNPTAIALMAGGQAFNQVNAERASIADLSNTPPESYSSFNTDFVNASIGRLGFVIKAKGVKMEEAKIIDDYFTMFGYKISTIKRPNIFRYLKGEGTRIRPSFNYIKTSNCLVQTKTSTVMCDTTMLSNIATIFNNGITFWEDKTDMGNYSLSNDPEIIPYNE